MSDTLTYLVAEKKEKINIALPQSMVTDLRRLVPVRQRTQWLTQIIAERLVQLKQQTVLREARGAWRDEDHPDLQTAEDVEKWLGALRASTNERLQRSSLG